MYYSLAFCIENVVKLAPCVWINVLKYTLKSDRESVILYEVVAEVFYAVGGEKLLPVFNLSCVNHVRSDIRLHTRIP